MSLFWTTTLLGREEQRAEKLAKLAFLEEMKVHHRRVACPKVKKYRKLLNELKTDITDEPYTRAVLRSWLRQRGVLSE